jgi:hypothetical protein
MVPKQGNSRPFPSLDLDLSKPFHRDMAALNYGAKFVPVPAVNHARSREYEDGKHALAPPERRRLESAAAQPSLR